MSWDSLLHQPCLHTGLLVSRTGGNRFTLVMTDGVSGLTMGLPWSTWESSPGGSSPCTDQQMA